MFSKNAFYAEWFSFIQFFHFQTFKTSAMKILYTCAPFVLCFFLLVSCGEKESGTCKNEPKAYAVYAEYARDSNVHMQPDLNRRVFNVTETACKTKDIRLEKDGSITLEPGTYRINGFSIVTMQLSVDTPALLHNNTYPGYCILYPKIYEDSAMIPILEHANCVGTLSTAYSSTPSLFDCIVTFKKTTSICLGHQAGHDLHNEVYLDVYTVDGTSSDYHVMSRIAVAKMGDE